MPTPPESTEAEKRVVELEKKLALAQEALKYYADRKNWDKNGGCDPASKNFDGHYRADTALSELA